MSFVPTSTTIIDPWTRILGALEKKVNRQSFNTWLKPTRFSHLNGRMLFVRIPSADFQHVGDRYGDLIQEAIDKLELEIDDGAVRHPAERPPCRTSARAREDGGFPPSSAACARRATPARRSAAAPATNAQQATLRLEHRLAAQPALPVRRASSSAPATSSPRAAAQAVAERPSKAYNPLFLYGGVGMGKTHLMHAIGHEVKRRQPHASICYVSGEKFTNEMINSVRYDKMTSFRDKFRNVDVLLIDDIQFLAGKERTQEEFFHTFNALHESMKQIVIASDRPPKELRRLRRPPALALRVGPDRRHPAARSRDQGRHPAEEGRERADRAAHRRRALHRLQRPHQRARARRRAGAPASPGARMHGVEITLPTAQQCLKQFIDTQVRKITIEAIQRAVAEQFGMRVAELKQKNNSRQIVVPRQIAMYLAKQMTEASLPEIGRQFGGKHHTTVMHSIAQDRRAAPHRQGPEPHLNKLMETLNN